MVPKHYPKLNQKQRREVRERYVKFQGNKCYHCYGDLTEKPPTDITCLKINWDLFPPYFLRHPIHLHHDHNTGMTIGAVHAYCNAVLWQYYGE